MNALSFAVHIKYAVLSASNYLKVDFGKAKLILQISIKEMVSQYSTTLMALSINCPKIYGYSKKFLVILIWF